MNQVERFKAVCRGESVDYVPILGLPGASGVAFGGAWGEIYHRLIATGMSTQVIGWTEENAFLPEASQPWSRFWGTLSPITVTFWACDHPGEVRHKKTIKDGYEILEYETGAVTRQILNNDDSYSMPEFERYHIHDRASWDRYRTCMTPSAPWSPEKIALACAPYRQMRHRPLCFNLGGTWGELRDLVGPERACMMLYDDPELAREIIQWRHDIRKTYQLPLMEYLKPDIILTHEDCCYNHGMMFSPKQFMEFCAPAYRDMVQWKEAFNIEMLAFDSDGDVRRLLPLLVELGVNALYPLEAKGNPDLLVLREENPSFIFLGGLEKEVINEGNEDLIESEIDKKVPPLLKRGRYFPNIDHTLQPMCTYDNVRRFMTKLHDALNNPEGDFPRT